MAYARQLLGQFGLQCGCAHNHSLPEPMQGIMKGDAHPKSGIYDGGDCFHITSAIAMPLYTPATL